MHHKNVQGNPPICGFASIFVSHGQVCDTNFMPWHCCEAILFDLDGVLVDSTPIVSRVWRQWAIKHGFNPEYVIHAAHGRRTIETVQALAPHLDAQAETDWVETREINNSDGLLVVPGARELLGSLPPDRFTVVTSGIRPLATIRLRAAGLPVPAAMVTADDVAHGKPDPEPYLKGAALLGFEPGDCLVFEDAPSGLRSAKTAGMCTVGVSTTYPAEQLSTADWVIPTLDAVKVTQENSSPPRLRVHFGLPNRPTKWEGDKH
jgi:sugar-phosphatase